MLFPINNNRHLPPTTTTFTSPVPFLPFLSRLVPIPQQEPRFCFCVKRAGIAMLLVE